MIGKEVRNEDGTTVTTITLKPGEQYSYKGKRGGVLKIDGYGSLKSEGTVGLDVSSVTLPDGSMKYTVKELSPKEIAESRREAEQRAQEREMAAAERKREAEQSAKEKEKAAEEKKYQAVRQAEVKKHEADRKNYQAERGKIEKNKVPGWSEKLNEMEKLWSEKEARWVKKDKEMDALWEEKVQLWQKNDSGEFHSDIYRDQKELWSNRYEAMEERYASQEEVWSSRYEAMEARYEEMAQTIAEEVVAEEEIRQSPPAQEQGQPEELRQSSPAQEQMQSEEIRQSPPAQEQEQSEEIRQSPPAQEQEQSGEIRQSQPLTSDNQVEYQGGVYLSSGGENNGYYGGVYQSDKNEEIAASPPAQEQMQSEEIRQSQPVQEQGQPEELRQSSPAQEQEQSGEIRQSRSAEESGSTYRYVTERLSEGQTLEYQGGVYLSSEDENNNYYGGVYQSDKNEEIRQSQPPQEQRQIEDTEILREIGKRVLRLDQEATNDNSNLRSLYEKITENISWQDLVGRLGFSKGVVWNVNEKEFIDGLLDYVLANLSQVNVAQERLGGDVNKMMEIFTVASSPAEILKATEGQIQQHHFVLEQLQYATNNDQSRKIIGMDIDRVETFKDRLMQFELNKLGNKIINEDWHVGPLGGRTIRIGNDEKTVPNNVAHIYDCIVNPKYPAGWKWDAITEIAKEAVENRSSTRDNATQSFYQSILRDAGKESKNEGPQNREGMMKVAGGQLDLKAQNNEGNQASTTQAPRIK